LLDVSFLVIDDIGNEKITDWSKEEIYDIIDARYQKGLLTIFTSDYSIDELKELYGKKDLKNRKLFSRLESYSTEIELLGIQVK
jgi:DNA replication protein DnaC